MNRARDLRRMKRARWGLLVVLLALVALWLLDFEGAQQAFESSREARSYVVGASAGQKVTHGSSLALYVAEEDQVARQLKAILPWVLVRQLPFTGVVRLAELPEKVGGPVLIVEFTDRRSWWTPVYARWQAKVRIAYASDGAIAWRHEEPLVIVGAAEPTLRARLEVEARGTSSGVVSRPAHARHTAQALAEEIVRALSAEFEAP